MKVWEVLIKNQFLAIKLDLCKGPKQQSHSSDYAHDRCSDVGAETATDKFPCS